MPVHLHSASFSKTAADPRAERVTELSAGGSDTDARHVLEEGEAGDTRGRCLPCAPQGRHYCRPLSHCHLTLPLKTFPPEILRFTEQHGSGSLGLAVLQGHLSTLAFYDADYDVALSAAEKQHAIWAEQASLSV